MMRQEAIAVNSPLTASCKTRERARSSEDFANCLVDDRAKGRDIADQLAPHQLCVQELGFGCNKGGGQSVGDSRRRGCNLASQFPARTAEIRAGKYNASADNPDADLA